MSRPLAIPFVCVLVLAALAAPARAGYVSGEDDPFWTNPNIPDYDGNDDLYTDVLQRTITLSGAPAGAVVTEVEIRLDLHHTYVGDLRVWVGTDSASVVLWDRDNTPDDDGIHRFFWAATEFDGQDPNQDWYLYIKDMAAQDTGELESWSITVWYSDCTTDADCGPDERCVGGSCTLSSCGTLGYPLGACSSVSSDGDCSDDGFEALECVAVGSLKCWELRDDCSIQNGICQDTTFGAATCIYSGHGDFCAVLGNYGYGCEHGESDCDGDGQCIEGLECMGPLLGGQDGCCAPGEAWTGEACSTTNCEALGYPEGACGAVGADGDCAAGFDKVLECQDVGPANCWVVRETCGAEMVCWDSNWSAALCIGDGHDDYCAALAAAGGACAWGESDCDGDGECAGDLQCKGPLIAGRDGCCEANEEWNGAACVPTDCVTLGYPQGGCGAVGSDICSGDGGEVWECVDAGPSNCWDVRETCGEGSVCRDPSFGAAGCIDAGHGDYCSALVAAGRACGYGESDCDGDAQCADGLECQGPTWPLPGDDGCCPPDESWNGENCGDFCEAECVAGMSGCDNPTRRWTCGEADDGDACLDRILADCAAGQVCQDGRCVSADACTTSADCPAAEHCSSLGRCAPDICPQGETVCRGDRVMQCNEDGSGESELDECGAGAVCVNGACGCIDDPGCPADAHCAELIDADPFFADFAGAAGEPAWDIGQGPLSDPLGTVLCTLDPRAADSTSEAGGAAALTVPAEIDPPLCARMTSVREDIGPGSLRVRLRAPGDPHTRAEVALRRGDAWISLVFDGGGAAVTLSVIANDGHEETRRHALPFDATATQHVYGFDWEPGSIALVVDHVPVADVTATPALSTEGGALSLVNWTAVAPHALDGPPPVASTFVVDWLSWAPWPAACVDDVCPAGLRFCQDLEVRECDARGTSSVSRELCDVNCSGGACIGACAAGDPSSCAPEEYCGADGRCVPDVCEQDALFCEDGNLRQCHADGSGSSVVEQCDNGCRAGACLPADGCLDDTGCEMTHHCSVEGACVADVCPQGETYCDDLERRLCNANGSGSNLIETCAFACDGGRCASECVDDGGCADTQHCAGTACVPDVCEQGAVFCDGDERRRCNANGSASELLEVCAGGCENGACVGGPCEPACRGRECGDDGCGGSCGTCDAGWSCNAQGLCTQACTPTCGAKECGDDGCGGSCGACPDGSSCTAEGTCEADPVCRPDCINRQCGPDGCGGTCGTCGAGQSCNANAQCVTDPVTPPPTDTVGGVDAGGETPYVSGESDGGCAAGGGAATAPWALLLLAVALVLRRRRA